MRAPVQRGRARRSASSGAPEPLEQAARQRVPPGRTPGCSKPLSARSSSDACSPEISSCAGGSTNSPSRSTSGAVEREAHAALDDVGHVLGRQVQRCAEDGEAEGEAVEDVALGVAEHLGHRARLVAVAVDDPPAGLDHQPADRVGAVRPSVPQICQTGPCVSDGMRVGERAQHAHRPSDRSRSQRSRQRRDHLRRGAVARRARSGSAARRARRRGAD